jgi:glycosyltransferase involved in cell wall biosynthesis
MGQRRLNILRVITWLPVGGIERRIVATLPRLRERFNIELVCVRELGPLAADLQAAGVPVTLIPFRTRWDPRGLRQLAALMREREINLVHSHMYRSNVPATVAARMAGVKSVWAQVHNVGTWETRRQAWLDRALCHWRTGVIAVSERVQHDVMQQLRLPAERVRVVYNGVDLGQYQRAGARRGELRAAHGVAPGELVVLFAARLVLQKRTTDLLSAFAVMQREHPQQPLSLWIAGDGPQRAELEQQAAQLPNPAAVRFLGRSDRVDELMAAADIFVLPSTKEGFSNALVEAMASGLAIVASDVGGNSEAIRHGVDGVIVPPCAVEELTGALRQFINDSAWRHQAAASAARRAEAFSLERMLDNVSDLYERSAEQPRRGMAL